MKVHQYANPVSEDGYTHTCVHAFGSNKHLQIDHFMHNVILNSFMPCQNHISTIKILEINIGYTAVEANKIVHNKLL